MATIGQKAQHDTKRMWIREVLLAAMACIVILPVVAQTTTDDDIWRELEISEVDIRREKDHCLRLFCYYRYTDDGVSQAWGREFKLYRIYEGICQLDIRYSKRWDDGAMIITARNLVHPDRRGDLMEYYELKPYTFLEKARRSPKTYTMKATGDTTRVFTKRGLAGVAVRDTAHQELRISYNALSPDTAMAFNLLYAKARLSHVDARAVYRLEDNNISYVPQGNLKSIVFEGDMTFEAFANVGFDHNDKAGGLRETYHERTEIYVDSAVYLTRSDYRAAQRITPEKQREHSGYTLTDIDRLKQKLGVPPLKSEQLARIEAQRDWDDEFEQWSRVNKTVRTMKKAGEKVAEKMKKSEALQGTLEKLQQKAEQVIDSSRTKEE